MNEVEHIAIVADMISRHTNLGCLKPVSYLPISAIKSVLGMSVKEYCQIIENGGNKAVEFGPDVCCIKSGAVFAYNEDALARILDAHQELLSENMWPSNTEDFIQKISSEWFDEINPVMPVIRQAFGD